MALGTQHAAQEGFWYLVADDAKVAIRIHSGLCLGEDSAGDLNFQSDDAQIVFALVENAVVIQAASEDCDFQVTDIGRTRSVTIGVNDRAQVNMKHNTLEILLGFDRANYGTDTITPVDDARDSVIKIEVVSAKSALPYSREAHSPRSTVGEGESIASLLKPKRANSKSAAKKPKSARSHTSAAIDDIQKELAQSALSTDASVIRVSEPAHNRGNRLLSAIPYAILTMLISVSVTMVLIAPEEGYVDGAPQLAAPRLDQIRLTNLVAPFQGEELPEGEVMALALQSLIALHKAHPTDNRVHDGLTLVTHRITEAAMQRFELGDAFTAGRLIELAASTGVARAQVKDAIQAFSQPPETLTVVPVKKLHADRQTETQATAERSLPDIVAEPKQSETALSSDMTTEQRNPIISNLRSATIDQPAYVFQQYRTDTTTTSFVSSPLPLIDPLLVYEPSSLSGATGVQRQGARENQVAEIPSSASKPSGFDSTYQQDSQTDGGVVNASLQIPMDEQLETNPLLQTDPAEDVPALRQPLGFYSISQLTFIRRPAPIYPRGAPEGASGSLVVEITVTENGDVGLINVNGDAPSYFRKAALRAIRDWKFEPIVENNRPISVRTAIKFTFQG